MATSVTYLLRNFLISTNKLNTREISHKDKRQWHETLSKRIVTKPNNI